MKSSWPSTFASVSGTTIIGDNSPTNTSITCSFVIEKIYVSSLSRHAKREFQISAAVATQTQTAEAWTRDPRTRRSRSTWASTMSKHFAAAARGHDAASEFMDLAPNLLGSTIDLECLGSSMKRFTVYAGRFAASGCRAVRQHVIFLLRRWMASN